MQIGFDLACKWLTMKKAPLTSRGAFFISARTLIEHSTNALCAFALGFAYRHRRYPALFVVPTDE